MHVILGNVSWKELGFHSDSEELCDGQWMNVIETESKKNL